jgi:hypothetical protein
MMLRYAMELYPVGLAPIDVKTNLTAEEAVLIFQQEQMVFILSSVEWKDGEAILSFRPGNGVQWATIGVADPPKPWFQKILAFFSRSNSVEPDWRGRFSAPRPTRAIYPILPICPAISII